VLLDDADRVLLLQAVDPFDPGKGAWWELPGGGMEGSEPSGVAAARELYEETGMAGVDMGPCVWQHRARFTFAGYRFDQQEHIHVARAGAGAGAGVGSGAGAGFVGDEGRVEYRPAGLEALEAMAFRGARWWPVDELARHVADGGRVIPPWLVEQLPAVLVAGWPAEPIDMGELGDVF
jgi:8-oxo-dGTP pyrophosphatase MutT (NUDIX family)